MHDFFSCTTVFIISGCELTSSFHGKGKLLALKAARKRENHCDAFLELGESIDPSPNLVESLGSFVCCLYGLQSETDVNSARYILFTEGKYGEENLPPNRDSSLLHIKRANYECFIRRRCCEALINAPSPVGYGWLNYENSLQIHWLSMPAAPESLPQSINCGCKTGCASQRCSCKRSGVFCTDVGQCISCGNRLDRPLAEEDADTYATIVDDTDSSGDEMNEWEGLNCQ